jgi:hypothetical protein
VLLRKLSELKVKFPVLVLSLSYFGSFEFHILSVPLFSLREMTNQSFILRLKLVELLLCQFCVSPPLGEITLAIFPELFNVRILDFDILFQCVFSPINLFELFLILFDSLAQEHDLVFSFQQRLVVIPDNLFEFNYQCSVVLLQLPDVLNKLSTFTIKIFHELDVEALQLCDPAFIGGFVCCQLVVKLSDHSVLFTEGLLQTNYLSFVVLVDLQLRYLILCFGFATTSFRT